MNESRQVFRASAWRWIIWLVFGGLIIYFTIQSGINSDGSRNGYYAASVVILFFFMLIAFFVSRANMVIEDGYIQHRTILGTKSKSVELNKLIDFHTYISYSPRQWNTIMKLADSNGNQIRVRIKSWYFINLPTFAKQKVLLALIKSHVPKTDNSK